MNINKRKNIKLCGWVGREVLGGVGREENHYQNVLYERKEICIRKEIQYRALETMQPREQWKSFFLPENKNKSEPISISLASKSGLHG